MVEEQPKRRVIKVTVNLSEDSVQRFRLLALRHGVTNTEELNQIINDRMYLEEQIANGSKVLLEAPDGKITQVHFGLEQAPKLGPEDRQDPFHGSR